jgi:hypothetical protein
VTARDRFYKSPFRLKTFPKILPSNFGQISTQKQYKLTYLIIFDNNLRF